MKTTITLAQLRASIANVTTPDGLHLISLSPLNKLANASLSATMMFWTGRITDDCRKEFERLDKRRVALVEKYRSLKKDENGADIPDQWEFTKEARIGYEDEFNELLEEQIEIESKTFTINDLEKYSAKLEIVEFNGNDMKTLDWLIVMPADAEAPKPVESIAEHQAKKEQAA